MAKAYAPIYSKDNMELDISGIGNLELDLIVVDDSVPVAFVYGWLEPYPNGFDGSGPAVSIKGLEKGIYTEKELNNITSEEVKAILKSKYTNTVYDEDKFNKEDGIYNEDGNLNRFYVKITFGFNKSSDILDVSKPLYRQITGINDIVYSLDMDSFYKVYDDAIYIFNFANKYDMKEHLWVEKTMMDIYNSYSNCKTVNYPWSSYIPFNYEQREGR